MGRTNVCFGRRRLQYIHGMNDCLYQNETFHEPTILQRKILLWRSIDNTEDNAETNLVTSASYIYLCF